MRKAHLYEAIFLVNQGIDQTVRGLARLKRLQDAMTADHAIRKNQGSRSMQEILEMIGRRIRSERKGKAFSQEGFAEVCGLHRTEMGPLERGKTVSRLDTLLIVSQCLGLPVSELLQGLEP